ncbi:MAG: VOC family protein [Caldilineaceae bacterium]
MKQIHPNTTMGVVSLIVADLARSLRYYQHNIGLQLNRQADDAAWLGAGGQDLLHLTERPGARPVVRGRTGLYHFALLTPSRFELARTLQHLLDTQTPIGGASDHAVSEALYLSDPDGHGIEIYRDRPRETWEYPNGTIKMTIDPFDGDGVLAELANGAPPWIGIDPATTMGHVHLHVAHIPAAEHFYGEVLGFDLMVRYGPAASFMAAGGYHHHLGLNTWAGVGAPPPPTDAARLNWFEVRVPDHATLDAVAERARAANLPLQPLPNGWSLDDPAHNQVHLVQAG